MEELGEHEEKDKEDELVEEGKRDRRRKEGNLMKDRPLIDRYKKPSIKYVTLEGGGRVPRRCDSL